MVGNNVRRTVVDGRQQEVEEDDADEEHGQDGDDDAGDARVALLGVEPGQGVGGELGVEAHGGFGVGEGLGCVLVPSVMRGAVELAVEATAVSGGDVRGRGDLRLFLLFFFMALSLGLL